MQDVLGDPALKKQALSDLLTVLVVCILDLHLGNVFLYSQIRYPHLQVLTRLIIDRFSDIDPKPTLTLVPQNSLAEFWLPLTAFYVGQDAKNGCQGLTWGTSPCVYMSQLFISHGKRLPI